MACRRDSCLLWLLQLCAAVLVVCSQPLPIPQPQAPDVTVVAGQQADLVCTVQNYQGTGQISIDIMKQSGSTPASSTSTTQFEGGARHTLSITAATLQDAGVYSCMASALESGDSQFTTFRLDIQAVALLSSFNNTTVSTGTDVTFSCVFNKDVSVTWSFNNQPLNTGPKYSFSGPGQRELAITNATYAQVGVYTCQTLDTVPIQSSANLSIAPAYEPLRRIGTQGQGSVVTSESIKVECPITGVPGWHIIIWQRGALATSPNLTTEENTAGNDPFIDADGNLDFSRATPADTGHYRCTGVDELGAQAGQTFFVAVTDDPTFVIWIQWYMILVYCVVGVALLIFVALLIWFLCTVRRNWCVRVEKKVYTKEHARRSKKALIARTPLPTDEGIDAYAMNEFNEDSMY